MKQQYKSKNGSKSPVGMIGSSLAVLSVLSLLAMPFMGYMGGSWIYEFMLLVREGCIFGIFVGASLYALEHAGGHAFLFAGGIIAIGAVIIFGSGFWWLYLLFTVLGAIILVT
jgi:hypothetical protein